MGKQQIQSIGTYRILEVIQDVPESILLRAVDAGKKDQVLVKIYFPKLKWADYLINEFFDRISYLKFIEHENLLEIVDFGKFQDTPYVVYPYHPFIFCSQSQQFEQKDQEEFLRNFYQIANVLDYLHRQEIVHGLLGPDTILVNEAGCPKIFDHGISEILKKVLSENIENNFAFLCLSNVKYTAPEILQGGSPTRQSDIYSFSLLFCFGIFGELPLEGKTAPETAILHLESNLFWIKRVSQSLSRNALTVIERSLASRPEKRFESFEQILRLLEGMEKSNKKTRLVTYNFTKKSSLKQAQVNSVPTEHDSDMTIDNLGEIQESAKNSKKTQQNQIFAAILGTLLILMGIVTTSYYVLGPKKTVPDIGSPLASTPMITETKSEIVVVSNTPDIQIIDSPTETPILPTSNGIPPSSLIKPALEGQAITIPSEKISLDNFKSLRELSRLGLGKPEDVDISDDSKYFAVATSAGVFIYTNSNYFVKWLDPGDWSTSVQFSPDGNLIAVGLENGEIQVWDWTTEYKNFVLNTDGHSRKVTRILFSKNGRHIFSASSDQNVIMWDLNSQKPIRKILAHSVAVEDIAVSEDERTLVSGAGDQMVRVWDLASEARKPVWEIPFQGNVMAVAITSDGEYIAAGGDGGMIRQWSLVSRQQRTDAIPVKKRIWGIQYIDGNNTLFVALDDGEIRNYSASQLKYEGESLDFKIPVVDTALIKSLGSDFRAESFSDTFGNKTNGVSILWDGRVINSKNNLTQPIFDNLDHLIFSQDGKVIAAQGKRGITSVWNINKNQVLYKESAELPHGQPISPNGSSIAVIVPIVIHTSITGNGVVDIKIYRWVNLNNTNSTRDLSEVIPDGTVSYSKDGNLFVSGGTNRSKLWDYDSGFETFFTSYPSNGCWVTASANDGAIFQVVSAVGAFFDWNEQVINICRTSFYQQRYLLAISQDLSLLSYVKANGWLEVYDPVTNKVLWTNNNHEEITAMAVSPNGSIIALGDPSGNLTFLDGKTGSDLFTVIGNYGALQAITFSDDGNVVATGGFDGTVRLFGVVSNQ